jgi:threonine dehydrogenase-like Zn-dependent dehydrogenase
VQPQTSSDVGSTRTLAGCRPATAREAVARSPLIEPLSVAHHAVTRGGAKKGDVALVGGAGPIGLLVAAMLKSLGVRTIVTELSEARKAKALSSGVADYVLDPSSQNVKEERRGDMGWGKPAQQRRGIVLHRPARHELLNSLAAAPAAGADFQPS